MYYVKDYSAIVIAAGLSSRMEAFKPLLDVCGKPVLFRLLDTIQASGIQRVIVVTGYRHTLVEAQLRNFNEHRVTTIYNADYEIGMFSSVQAGIREAARGWEAGDVLLFPVDVPLVDADTIAGLIRAYEQSGRSGFAVPVHNNNNGHPLLIPHKFFDEILNYTGEGGLKGVRSRHDGSLIRYHTDDAGCVLDIDTPEDYEALLEFYKLYR